ncbi:MAG: hypothetical protein R3F20_03580 [Planctomycetota bacterium]
MTRSLPRRLALLFAFALLSGCGESPSPPAPRETRVADLVAGDVRIRLGEARLTAGGASARPDRIGPPLRVLGSWEDGRLIEEDARLRWTSADGETTRLEVTRPDSRELGSAGRVGSTALLLSIERDGYGQVVPHETSNRILRLDLVSGRWLEPIDLPFRDLLGPPAVAVHENRLAVLVHHGTRKSGEDALKGYSLALYRDGTTAPLWTRSFEVSSTRPYAGVYVSGIRPPDHASSATTPVAWMGESLLVCAEALQPLVCLKAGTGETEWQLERIWEFERGFTGPSVFAHFVGRFGQDPDIAPEDDENLVLEDEENLEVEESGEPDEVEEEDAPPRRVDTREDFYRHYRGAVVGGPIVVPSAGSKWGGPFSAFVAVVIERWRQEYPGFTSHCRVYEVDTLGEVIALVDLPHVLQGWNHRADADGVIWAGDDATLFRLRPVPEPPIAHGMGGNTDHLIMLDWMRRAPHRPSSDWRTSRWPIASPALGPDTAVLTPQGLSVVAPRDSSLRFPMSAVDLATGSLREFTIEIPFAGDLERPDEDPDLRPVEWTSPANRFGLVDLVLRRSTLIATFGFDEDLVEMEFDLDAAGLRPPERR